MILGVVITSYNNQETLASAIKSVASLKNKNKIYIAVIDDFSKDSSAHIARQEKKNKQVDAICLNKKNFGVSRSRNIGIELCQHTDYITFLDGDDMILSGLSSALQQNFFYADLITFKFNYVNNGFISENSFYKTSKELSRGDVKKYFYKYLNKPNKHSLFTTCWAKLYKTNMLLSNKNLRFNQELHLCEDTEFVFRFLSYAKKVQYINTPIYLHTLGSSKENTAKLTFGVNLSLAHQISFLEALKTLTKFLCSFDKEDASMERRIDHCIGAYICIYTIRSCLRINSISTFGETYFFWKNVYKKNEIQKAMNNYSPNLAGGSQILPFLIQNRMYFFSILTAFFICRKRY